MRLLRGALKVMIGILGTGCLSPVVPIDPVHRPADGGVLGDAGTEPPSDGGPRPDQGLDASLPPEDAGAVDPPRPGCPLGDPAVCQCGYQSFGHARCSAAGYEPCVCPPQPPPPQRTEQEHLARIRAGMAGLWWGVGNSMWTGDYPVEILFRKDGTYSSRCLVESCSTFYWGDDGGDDSRQWRVFDVTASLEGSGEIEVTFSSGARQRGPIDSVYLSTNEGFLAFRFWNTWLGDRAGPVEFRLGRVSR